MKANTKLLQAALDYFDKKGWFAIPQTSGRTPPKGLTFADKTLTRAIVSKWFKSYPQAKYLALIAGKQSGLVVLDVDNLESLKELQKEYEPLPKTYKVRTRSDNRHYYFQWPNGSELRSGPLPGYPQIEIKGQNQLTTAWPSLGYEVLSDVEPAEMPDWLIKLAQQTRGMGGLKPNAANHNRNNSLMSLAGSLQNEGLPLSKIFEELSKVNEKIDEPLSREEVYGIAKKSEKYKEVKYTHASIAAIVAYLHKDKIRHWTEKDRWLGYDGRRWSIERGKDIAKDLIMRTIYSLMIEARAKNARRELRSQLKGSNILQILSLLQARKELWVSDKELDQQEHLFNCLNGTIDLRTGILKKHDPSDLITACANVEYPLKIDKEPKGGVEYASETWVRCCKEWMEDDKEMVTYLQDILGYCLTGHTMAKVFFLFIGNTNTGRSTCTDTIKWIMGDYAGYAPRTLFKSSIWDRHPAELETMRGKRFMIIGEPDEKLNLRKALVKAVSGDEYISSRGMRQDFKEFKLQVKFVLISNKDPIIPEGGDPALWGRLKKVQWNYQIPEDEQDKYLKEDLHDDGNWILAWMVQGAIKWYATETIKTPDKVVKATQQYKTEQNPLKEFVEDCIKPKPGNLVANSDMYRVYLQWCKIKHRNRLLQADFTLQLKSLSYKRRKTMVKGSQDRYWQDIEAETFLDF